MYCECQKRMIITESGYKCECGCSKSIVDISIETEIATVILTEIHQYIVNKAFVCSFLQAVLENNLIESYQRADDYNSKTLRNIVKYLYINIPADAWGSKEKVCQWLKCQNI